MHHQGPMKKQCVAVKGAIYDANDLPILPAQAMVRVELTKTTTGCSTCRRDHLVARALEDNTEIFYQVIEFTLPGLWAGGQVG